ncbi:MAG: TRAP transporter small permease [Steroidobacteraceae bacterium]|nr:TRAP transporter small permease [Steroidobacteraceae bacterium]
MAGFASTLVRALDRAAAALAAVNAPLARAGRNLAALLIAAMVALAVAPILSRALFDHALDWAEELARATLVWSVLTALPYAFRRGAHVAIDSFAVALPPRLLLAAAFAINALVIWVCAIFFVESLGFFERGLSIVSTTMGFPVAWIYSIVPASFALLIAVGAELQLRLGRSFVERDPDLLLAGAVPGVKPGPGEE